MLLSAGPLPRCQRQPGLGQPSQELRPGPGVAAPGALAGAGLGLGEPGARGLLTLGRAPVPAQENPPWCRPEPPVCAQPSAHGCGWRALVEPACQALPHCCVRACAGGSGCGSPARGRPLLRPSAVRGWRARPSVGMPPGEAHRRPGCTSKSCFVPWASCLPCAAPPGRGEAGIRHGVGVAGEAMAELPVWPPRAGLMARVLPSVHVDRGLAGLCPGEGQVRTLAAPSRPPARGSEACPLAGSAAVVGAGEVLPSDI